MNLRLMLERAADQYAGKTAILMGERRLSFNELDETSNRVANSLLKLGVRKGDRVAMVLANSPDFTSVFFGITRIGAIAVALDTRYKIYELTSVFGNCQPKVLITESPFLDPIIPALPGFKHIEQVINLGPGHEGKFLSYSDIVSTSPSTPVRVELSPDDVASISYSGGNTTDPKGVMLSHYSLVTEAKICGDGFKQTDKDAVMLFALPMYHQFGATLLLTAVTFGSTVVIVPGTGVSINSLMATIERERGTMLLGVPYIFALAVKMARREGIKSDLDSLRVCGSGGAPLPVSTIRQFKRYYHLPLLDFWGQTESACQITCQPIDGSGKLGSVGKVLPGWELKAVDDNDNELPVNQSGELVARGPMMKGYYNNPKATAETLRNGWLHTRDLGRIDEDRYVYITGRKRRMLILKGQNVYPSDIEAVLRSHLKIAEATVMGIPDRLRGEIVRAVIRLKEGAVATQEEIRHFCLERMADYKLPKQIIFERTRGIQRTAKAGKKRFEKHLSRLSRLTHPPSKTQRANSR